jgi:hypothetical protein
MPKKEQRVVVLSDFIEEHAAESVIIRTPTGDLFVPSPLMWPDEAIEAGKQGDMVAWAKALLGDAQYATYTSSGGTANMLSRMIADAQGVAEGE